MGKQLNWKEIWEEMQKQRMKPLEITFDHEFRAKFSEDYFKMSKYNNYEYGREAADALNASNNYCAVIQPAGRDSMVNEMWTKITGESYRGEFDPDADYFAYLIDTATVGKVCECANHELQHREELRAGNEVHSEFYR